jgi:mitogen-activated protein kinase kinase kinase 1
MFAERKEIVEHEELPELHKYQTWVSHATGLTDKRWFELCCNRGEIRLRIKSSDDTRTFRPQSRCFAKRVSDVLCMVLRSQNINVSVSSSIVLEDTADPNMEYSLDKVRRDEKGFVSDPEQLMHHTASLRVTAKDLWPESLARHSLVLQRNECREALDPNKLKLYDQLGVGTFAVVKKASYDGLMLAAKQLSPPDYEIKMVERECKVHFQLRCRTVLRMFGVCPKDGSTYLLLEYACFGNLKNVYINARISKDDRNTQGLDASLRWRVRWLRDVAEALRYLHNCKVLHRDIKCENILLREDKTALVGDFGLSRELSAGRCFASSQGIGTPAFMAPEIAGTQTKHDERADVYSFGITILELLLATIPASRNIGLAELQRVAGKHNHELQLKELCEIAEQCSTSTPADRPDASTVHDRLEVLLQQFNVSSEGVSGHTCSEITTAADIADTADTDTDTDTFTIPTPEPREVVKRDRVSSPIMVLCAIVILAFTLAYALRYVEQIKQLKVVELRCALKTYFANSDLLTKAKFARDTAYGMFTDAKKMQFAQALRKAQLIKTIEEPITSTPYRAIWAEDKAYSIYPYTGDYLGNPAFLTEHVVQQYDMLDPNRMWFRLYWQARVLAYQTHLSIAYVHSGGRGNITTTDYIHALLVDTKVLLDTGEERTRYLDTPEGFNIPDINGRHSFMPQLENGHFSVLAPEEIHNEYSKNMQNMLVALDKKLEDIELHVSFSQGIVVFVQLVLLIVIFILFYSIHFYRKRACS